MTGITLRGIAFYIAKINCTANFNLIAAKEREPGI